VTHQEVPKEDRPAEIEITITQAKALAGVGAVLGKERRRKGGVEEPEFIYHYLDLAGVEIRIGHSLGSNPNHARHGEHILGAEVVSPFMGPGVALGIEHHLGHAAPVTEIDEDETAVVPATLHPTHQYDRLPHMLCAEAAAIVAALPVTEGIEGHTMPSYQ
jgi:hypothetical protein